MNNRKTFVTLGALLALTILLPSARAAQHDQATKLTFSRQVQIPGRVACGNLLVRVGGQPWFPQYR